MLAAMVVVALGGSACFAEERESPSRDERWCTHRYLAGDEGIPVCATLPLEPPQLDRLARQLREVKALYPRFASSCGAPFHEDALQLPTLHVVRYDEINDRAAFPRDEGVGNILGRYYVGRSSVFITERALDERGGFHLPHELAHWIHDRSGLTDADEDERLARAFHRFYRARTRAEHDRPGGETVASNAGLLLAQRDDDGPSTHDRSLAERVDGANAVPLFEDLCGR